MNPPLVRDLEARRGYDQRLGSGVCHAFKLLSYCVRNRRNLMGSESHGRTILQIIFSGLLSMACLFFCDVLPAISSEYGVFSEVGRISSREISECSGLVASRRNPGILWAHNDSGDLARLFAVREDGSLRGIYRLYHAGAVDWEDIARGPCTGSAKAEDCLFIGDIGDNRHSRVRIQIYRVREPLVSLQGSPETVFLKGIERFDCVYPDGPHDAEALLVDPASGIPYLVTKEIEGPTWVYRFPSGFSSGQQITLERIACLDNIYPVTGGDVFPDGSRVILRDYLSAYDLTRPPGGAFADVFSSLPLQITLVQEAQGESLAVGLSGEALYTVGEGYHVPIHKSLCTVP